MGWWLQEEILQCKAQIWVVHKLWQMMRKQSAKMDIHTHVAKKKITNNVKRKTDRFTLANLSFRVATVNPQAACRPYHHHHHLHHKTITILWRRTTRRNLESTVRRRSSSFFLPAYIHALSSHPRDSKYQLYCCYNNAKACEHFHPRLSSLQSELQHWICQAINPRLFLCQFSGWNLLKNVLKEFDAQSSKLDKEFTKAACKQFADSLHNPEMNLQYAQSITGKSWRLILMHPYHEDPPASSEFFFLMY